MHEQDVRSLLEPIATAEVVPPPGTGDEIWAAVAAGVDVVPHATRPAMTARRSGWLPAVASFVGVILVLGTLAWLLRPDRAADTPPGQTSVPTTRPADSSTVAVSTTIPPSTSTGEPPTYDDLAMPPLVGEIPAPTGWIDVPEPPLDLSSMKVRYWTGTELVIWGPFTGDRVGVSGAAWSPATNSWRDLPDAPVGMIENLRVVEAPEPGSGFIVWDGAVAMSFESAVDHWSVLEDWPLVLSNTRSAVVVWTDDAIVDLRSGIAWEVGSASTRPISPPPLLTDNATAVWTGDLAVVLPDGEIYDPAADSWASAGNPGLSPNFVTAMWDGERLLVVDHEHRTAVLEPSSGRWELLPEVPVRFSEGGVGASVVAGRWMAAASRAFAVWDGDAGGWVPLAYPFGDGFVTPAGDWLLAQRTGTSEFRAWDVATLAEDPGWISVGLARIALPTGWGVAAASASADSDTVEVDGPSGPCTLVGVYTNDDVVGSATAVLRDGGEAGFVTRSFDGAAVPVILSSPGPDGRHHGFLVLGTSDTLDVTCDSRAALDGLLPNIAP